MATISPRKTASGVSYTAQIRKKRNGIIVYSEAQTWPTKAKAQEWARKREVELAEPGALDHAIENQGKPDRSVLLGPLVKRYKDEFSALSGWGRTKDQHLDLVGRLLPDLNVETMTSEALVNHVRWRRTNGITSTTGRVLEAAGPATALGDLIWISTVCRAARGAWGVKANLSAIEDAYSLCRELRLVAKSNQRDRRPTADELDRIFEHYRRGDGRMHIAHDAVLDFALNSARREDEICSLLRADLNREESSIIVRDMKNPNGSNGNDTVVKLTHEAMAIIDAQPEIPGEPRIFPYNSKSVGAQFTRTAAILGIEDLTFHDMRHEAICRLFEAGYQIHEVAQFTGHRSWATLKRYTHLRPKNLKLR